MSMNSHRSLRLSSSMTMWSIAMFLGAVIMGGCVFAVTQNAQQHENAIETMNRDIVSERQSIRVLEAEWAYLTRPQRLEELMAMKSAEIMPPVPAPIATLLPEEGALATVAEDVAPEPEVAKTEPAAGVVKIEEPKKVAAVKKQTPKEKTVSVPASVKAKAKVQKTAKVDDVWKIEKKKPVSHTAYNAPVYRPTPVSTRSGRQIARPILE